MGYTVYVVAKSPKKRDELYAELKKVLRHKEFCKEQGIDMVGARLAMGVATDDNDSLSYCRHKLAVGFDYSSWTNAIESAYIYRVIMKVARLIGATEFYYDGDAEPLWDNKPPFLPYISPWKRKKIRASIKKEIDELWIGE